MYVHIHGSHMWYMYTRMYIQLECNVTTRDVKKGVQVCVEIIGLFCKRAL